MKKFEVSVLTRNDRVKKLLRNFRQVPKILKIQAKEQEKNNLPTVSLHQTRKLVEELEKINISSERHRTKIGKTVTSPSELAQIG